MIVLKRKQKHKNANQIIQQGCALAQIRREYFESVMMEEKSDGNRSAGYELQILM